MREIQEITVKKYIWAGDKIDRVSLIVRYDNDRVLSKTYHSYDEIPYKFRDFLQEAYLEDVYEIVPERSPYTILKSRYRKVISNV